jgi:RNA polymerase sigma factor (sigma-70 family)
MDAGRLFEEHHGALYRYLVRLTGDAETAADAAQETFVRLVERRPRDEQLRAWLYKVATNLVREWGATRTRRAGLARAGIQRLPVADPEPDPAAVFDAKQRTTAVRAALDALSERDRTVLLMREEGFTHREIAEAVGTTTGSVGTMIARALTKLAAELDLDGDES